MSQAVASSVIQAQQIEAFRANSPLLYEALVALRDGANGAVRRVQTGTAVLVAGLVVAPCRFVTPASIVYPVMQIPGGTVGSLYANPLNYVPGRSFIIQSTNNADTSTVAWLLVNP